MADDIVARVRQVAFAVSVNEQHRIGWEAADEILRLREEVETWKQAATYLDGHAVKVNRGK